MAAGGIGGALLWMVRAPPVEPVSAPTAAERPAPVSAAPAPAAPAAPRSAPAATRPALTPALTPDSAGAPLDEQPLWSGEEERDPSWATAQEASVRERIAPLLAEANREGADAVAVPQLECRESSCRMLVVGADEPAFRRFVEALQTRRGFYGDAANLALQGYSKTQDPRSAVTRHAVHVQITYQR